MRISPFIRFAFYRKPVRRKPPASAEKAKAADSGREPIWKRLGVFSETLRSLLINLGAIISVLMLGAYTLRDLARDDVIIEAFAVPPALEKRGYSGRVLAVRIGDRMKHIWGEVRLFEQSDFLSSNADIPEVTIPRTGISLQDLLFYARELFDIHLKTVTGEVVEHEGGYRLSIRITGQPTTVLYNRTPDAVVQNGAEYVFKHLNPYILGVYYNENYEPAKLTEFVKEIKDLRRSAGERAIIPLIEVLPYWEKDRERFVEGCERMGKHDYATGYMMCCYTSNKIERPEVAIRNCKQAIAIDPEYSTAYSDWGFALNEQKRYDEAISKFRKAVKLEDGNKKAWLNWGYSLRRKKDYDGAIEKYRKALEIDPDYMLAYNNIGVVYGIQDRYEEALEYYQKALALEPTSQLSLRGASLALFNLERVPEAIAIMRRALALEPNNYRNIMRMGQLLAREGRYAEALPVFEGGIALFPGDVDLRYERGVVFKETGRFTRAIADLDFCIQQEPDFGRAYYHRGDALAGMKRYGEARENLNKALELTPKEGRTRRQATAVLKKIEGL